MRRGQQRAGPAEIQDPLVSARRRNNHPSPLRGTASAPPKLTVMWPPLAQRQPKDSRTQSRATERCGAHKFQKRPWVGFDRGIIGPISDNLKDLPVLRGATEAYIDLLAGFARESAARRRSVSNRPKRAGGERQVSGNPIKCWVSYPRTSGDSRR